MKLLFDQNLSDRLVEDLAAVYPDSAHVRKLGLERAPDATVEDYARAHGFTIVTKDADFHERSILAGHPPKTVWIRRGNCSTAAISQLLRANHPAIEAFSTDAVLAVLILY